MKKSFLFFLGLALVALAIWKLVSHEQRLFLSPPDILGGVVRIADGEEGDRLYFLTSQWEKRLSRVGGSRSSSSTRTISWLDVDLWALDAATAQPVFRKRIKRDKVNGDFKALGVDQGILWARLPELVGIRLSDGSIAVDREKIEARNPDLKGWLPKAPQVGIFLTEQMQPLKFVPAVGLVVRLEDARWMRIDPLSLEATPYAPQDNPAAKPADETQASTRQELVSIANGMEWRAMVRGVPIARPDQAQDWLGLLAESELADLKERHVISHQMDFTEPRRHRLYRAKLQEVENFFGKQMQFGDPTLLPESPEFLMAGLLTQTSARWDQTTALWRRDPDSVFVLSRDRLGEDGRMQLARVTGPAGKPAWATALPLSNMSAWLPGERHALMLGPDPSAPRSPMAEERENTVMQVVSIDLDTGDVRSFNPDFHRDWPVDGKGGKTP